MSVSKHAPYFDDKLLKASIHNALDEYEVYVWNGKDVPLKKPIGEAITIVSENQKKTTTANDDLKKTIEEHNLLLAGLKDRKDFIDSLMNAFSKFKKFSKINPVIGFIIKAGAAFTSIYGVLKLAKELFNF